MNIANLKISTRLAANSGVMTLLLMIIIAIGMSVLSRLNENTTIIARDAVPKATQVTQALNDINSIAIALRNMMLSENEADRQQQRGDIVQARTRLQEKFDYLKRTIYLPKGKELLRKALDHDAKYSASTDQLLKLIASGTAHEQKEYLNQELRPVLGAYMAAMNEIRGFQVERMNVLSDDATKTYTDSRILILALGAASLFISIFMGYWITRSITRPLNRAVTVANTVAAGDLTSRIEVHSADETGQLLQALKNMNDSLIKIVGDVRNGTETINSASGEIASGNLDLSARTEQQASSLEETASSMEELTSTVKQNADNARQANGLAVTASDVARKGGMVVSQVVETMGSINDSSKKIVEIISVIDGIAFQTNILALNAAVEAARAGEQGRGFAVVASEVRNLAHRSAAAAKEIKALIDNSVDKVDAGSKLVSEAGSTMEEIVNSIQRVTDIMSEISAASQEQTAGIEQINLAISEMDSVTQQNAALVEEASAAAQSMQDQAATLSKTVSVFKLNGVQNTATRPVALQATKSSVVPLVRKAAPGKRVARATQPRKVANGSASGDTWVEF